MASFLGIEMGWEALQTLWTYWRGRQSANRATPPAAASGGGGADKPPEQQTTSVLKPNNDEAVQTALDAALGEMAGGMVHLENIRLVRMSLEPHQQASWRERLASYSLPVRYKRVLVSETTTPVGRGGQNAAGAGQPQAGPPRVDKKFERVARGYELTPDDPRIKHLILVSQFVNNARTVQEGVAAAKTYLLSAGLINTQSLDQKTATALKTGKEATNRTLYESGLGRSVKDEIARQEVAIEAEQNPATKKCLQRELEAYIVTESRAANTQAKRRLIRALQWFGVALFILIITGLIVAAGLKH